VAVYLKIRQGLYHRVRFILTGSLGLAALGVGLMRLADSVRSLDATGLILFILGALALFQLRVAAKELLIQACSKIHPLFDLLTARQLASLKELVLLFERNQLNCCIVGGVAYDALMAGRLSHIPSDLDMACLEEDVPALRAALVKAGFELTDRRANQILARRPGTIEIDVLIWQDGGEGMIQLQSGAEIYVVPRELFFQSQTAELNGFRFPVQGNDLAYCLIPLVAREKHRQFLRALPVRVRETVHLQWRPVSIRLREVRYELQV
ncbi:MAG: hypothetical protein WCG36_04480, partial [bacterium]